MAELDNHPPKPLTASLKLEHIEAIIQREDLTAAQKCVGVGIVVKADKNGVSEAKTHELQRFASVSDRETVFRATRRLHEGQIIEKANRPGQAGRYNIIPLEVTEAVEKAFHELQSSRAKADGMDADTGRVQPDQSKVEPVGSNPTGRDKAVGFDRTGRAEPDQPRAPAPARIETPSGLLSSQEKKDSTPLPPTPVESTFALDEPGNSAQHRRAAAKQRRQEAIEAVGIYNLAADHFGFHRCDTPSEPRLRRLENRLADIGGLENFKRALRVIGRDDWLMGRVAPREGKSPFKLGFDQLLSTGSNMGDVLARLLDRANSGDAEDGGLKPFWWRKDEHAARHLPSDWWRLVIPRYANGTWSVQYLGPGPWQPDKCLVPKDVQGEFDLSTKYPTPDGICADH